MAKHTLVVNCTRANLKRIRSFVAETLEPYALSEVQLNQLILAVDEICANFIIHSNREDASKSIKVEILTKANQLVFEISDESPAYNPGSYREPNLKDLIKQGRKGGVGILLVNRIMDSVEYSTVGGRNMCRLTKTL